MSLSFRGQITDIAPKKRHSLVEFAAKTEPRTWNQQLERVKYNRQDRESTPLRLYCLKLETMNVSQTKARRKNSATKTTNNLKWRRDMNRQEA